MGSRGDAEPLTAASDGRVVDGLDIDAVFVDQLIGHLGTCESIANLQETITI